MVIVDLELVEEKVDHFGDATVNWAKARKVEKGDRAAACEFLVKRRVVEGGASTQYSVWCSDRGPATKRSLPLIDSGSGTTFQISRIPY